MERLEDMISIEFRNSRDLGKAAKMLYEANISYNLLGFNRFLVPKNAKSYLEDNYGIKTKQKKMIFLHALPLKEAARIRKEHYRDVERAMKRLAREYPLSEKL